jgi:hypothetical protein
LGTVYATLLSVFLYSCCGMFVIPSEARDLGSCLRRHRPRFLVAPLLGMTIIK